MSDITRVNNAIARHIETFVCTHKEWHVEELRKFVFDSVGGYIAPASPDRILRDLRQKGRVNYVVVSRAKSLYRSLPMTQPTLF
jgi:hypothetical protein